jgi:predicted nucleic acid-binding protein
MPERASPQLSAKPRDSSESARPRRAGTPLADLDLQIACIALVHALPLATHNSNHFNHIPGLHLVDWLA